MTCNTVGSFLGNLIKTIDNFDIYECVACVEHCVSCSQQNECLQCDQDNGWLLNADDKLCYCAPTFYDYYGQCIKPCPVNSYIEGSKCFNCPPTCSACVKSGPNLVCTECPVSADIVLQQGQCVCTEYLNQTRYYAEPTLDCVTACPNGQFPYQANYSCVYCDPACSKCTDFGINSCQECNNGYFNFKSTSCLVVCPDGYFGNLFSYECELCKDPCSKCKDTATKCTACMQKTYYISTNNTCQNCSNYCLVCESATKCTVCDANFEITGLTNPNSCICKFYPTKYYFSKGNCLQSCPNQTYPSDLTRTCESCPTECVTCYSATYCTECITGFDLTVNNTCQCQPVNGVYQY